MTRRPGKPDEDDEDSDGHMVYDPEAGPGWAALPGKFGYTKIADGPATVVRLTKSTPSPEPLTMGEIRQRELAARSALDAYVPVPVDEGDDE
jgi:hypothetical protein